MVDFSLRSGGCSADTCVSKDGCPPNVCPDFIIRRHDTKPSLKISVEDCDGPLDLRGLVVEVNMWALAKLKSAIAEDDEYFRLADDIGFEQIMVGDIIVMDRVRMPEHMLVVAFDENNKLVKVQRGYHGTTPSAWKKGASLRIFRILNGAAESEMVYEDVPQVDGTTEKDVLTASYLVYEWQPEDTCVPGCFWLEFKLLKMIAAIWYLPGGHWLGAIHTHTDDYFYTGTVHTDSSVKLSYNQVDGRYYLPDVLWGGEIHLHTDDAYYTGASHDDGSVLLNKTGVSSDSDISYNEEGMALTDVSIVPSFTSESLTTADYGCVLGEGVEWVRRFPMTNEGFLIKIENSGTTEITSV